MCTHGRWITNKYTHENLFVPCGHCEACQIDKSQRYFSRIMNHEADSDYFKLFVTLNYDNASLPYIDFSEVDFESSEIPVYRNQLIYNVKNRYCSKHIVKHGKFNIGSIHVNDFDEKFFKGDLSGLCEPTKFDNPSCVGIIYSSDFSNFIKRFKIYALRYYNIDFGRSENKMHFYRIAEYGPSTFRPHFHALLYFPSSMAKDYQKLRRCIIAAWPFCSYGQISENIEVAISGQEYVSSYTVRPSNYPDFLKIRRISQKPTFSRGFGYGRLSFRPACVYSDVEKGIFEYDYTYTAKDGTFQRNTAGVPQYVYRRYFPKFKGFHLLNVQQIRSILATPYLIYYYNYILDYNSDDFITFHRSYYRAIDYIPQGYNLYDYIHLYLKYYTLHSCYQERVLHARYTGDYSDFYDNIADLAFKKVHAPTLSVPSELNPNNFRCRVHADNVKSSEFSLKMKKKKINDYVSSLKINYITHSLKSKRYAINS